MNTIIATTKSIILGTLAVIAALTMAWLGIVIVGIMAIVGVFAFGMTSFSAQNPKAADDIIEGRAQEIA